MAEWLRRWTRNPLGSLRVGSNPTDYGHCLVDEHSSYKEIKKNLVLSNELIKVELPP